MRFGFAIYKNAVHFCYCVALSAAATVANIKIRYDAKIPQFAIFGTSVIYVFYSIVLARRASGHQLDNQTLISYHLRQ